ncbi:MAG: transposase [Lewinellaceae bacterium]|nr:transposase [Lewinellaceae bacterium]
MRGNYTAVYIHAIWTTKYRLPILPKPIRYPLFEHFRETAKDKEIDLRIVNGVEDHVHCLFRLSSTQTYAWVLQMLKGGSSNWLNEQYFEQPAGRKIMENAKAPEQKLQRYWEKYLAEVGRFSWQDGYGALSVSPQNVGKATRYIFNQEKHHLEKSLQAEWKLFRHYSDLNEGEDNVKD